MSDVILELLSARERPWLCPYTAFTIESFILYFNAIEQNCTLHFRKRFLHDASRSFCLHVEQIEREEGKESEREGERLECTKSKQIVQAM